MKIQRTDNKNRITVNSSKDKDKISGKEDSFSSTLDMANRDQAEQNLREMLKDIDKLGKLLSSTRSVEDAKKYKKKIQEYLEFVVRNAYVLRKEPGPYNYGIRVRIDVINKKLDELTKQLLDEQKKNIEVADKIEEIRGLLVDVYK